MFRYKLCQNGVKCREYDMRNSSKPFDELGIVAGECSKREVGSIFAAGQMYA